MANIYDGSSAMVASVLNKDIVADFVEAQGWSAGSCRMEFFAEDDILLSINGSDPILFKGGDELQEDEIWSLILKEATKDYRFFAKYDTLDSVD